MARIINYQGRRISVPDDATDDQIRAILKSGNAPVGSTAAPPDTASPPNPAPPANSPLLSALKQESYVEAPAWRNILSPGDDAGRRLQVSTQGAGRGIADMAGLPVDLLTGGLNAGIGGVNWLAGTEMQPIERPFLGSDYIADTASSVADLFGAPTVPYEEMSNPDRMAYNINRFGSQAVAGSGALARQAAVRAPEIVAGTTKTATDAFLRPYLNNATRAATGDLASGVGSGVAVTAADEYAPDNPIAQSLAVLLGGFGGSAATDIAQGAGRFVSDAARPLTFRSFDPNLPIDPVSNMPVRVGDAEDAARMMQTLTRDPLTGVSRAPSAAASIGERAAGFRSHDLPVPTSGLISDNVGLQQAESAARARDGVPYIERDTRLRNAASERVASMRDPGADQSAVPAAAATARADRMAPVEETVTAATATDDAARQARLAEGAPLAVARGSDTRAAASGRLDEAVVTDTYLPDRAHKNQLYEAIDPEGTTMRDTAPLAAVVERIRDAEAALPASMQTRSAILNDIEGLIDPATGQARQISFRDLETMRMKLSRASREARGGNSPNFDLADAYDQLRAEIGQEARRMADEGSPAGDRARAARTNFAENYAPRYRAGPGDEMTRFTRSIDQDPTRSTTPPSATAGRFLSAHEKAAALRNVLDSSPSATQGRAAVRDYMLSDFAASVLNPDGTVNPRRAHLWASNNAAVLDEFPSLKGEFDDMVQRARSGEEATTATGAALKDALARQKLAEREIERSAIGTLLQEDPRDVARAIFRSGKYGAGDRLEEIARIVAHDAAARRGWKAAVSEVITDMVTRTTRLDAGRAAPSEAFRIELAAMERLFKDRADDLAKVFTPEEMSTLRQGHALLEPLRNAMVRASARPADDPYEQVWRLAEAGLKARFGVLKGGGILRTMRIAASTLPNNTEAVQRLIQRAFFDPEIAQYLLTRKVRDLDYNASNVWLRRTMAVAEGARESASPERQPLNPEEN